MSKDNLPVVQGLTTDWVGLETDYIQGYLVRDAKTGNPRHVFPTLKSLSKTYKVEYTTAISKSAKYRWKEKREKFQKQIKATRAAQNLSSMLSETSRFDTAHLNQVEILHALIDFYVNPYRNILQKGTDGNYTRFRQLDLDDEEDREFYNRYKPSMKDLATLMTMIKDSHQIVRNILGEPINASTIFNSVKNKSEAISTEVDKLTPEQRKQRIKDLEAKRKALLDHKESD